MKRLFWLLTMTMLTHSAVAADAVDHANLMSSALALDATSRQSLGIGIRALSLLLKASPRGFEPIWSLEKNGDLDVIEELDAKGYVVVTRTQGLPDGTDTGTVYVNYAATEKGQAVISAIIVGGSPSE